MNKIAIVLTAEKEMGIWELGSLMISVLKNTSKGYKIKFYILMEEELDKQDMEIINEIHKLYSETEIECINLSKNELYTDIGKIEYGIILCPDMVKETKCVYLGKNTIVKRDLSFLYEFDLGDNYIAGVQSLEATWENEFNENLKDILLLPDLKGYVYADVLIMNLQKMRADKIKERALSVLGKEYPSKFQDVINMLCKDKVAFLPLQYNVSNAYCKDIESWSTELYSENELYQADQFPVIIRYISGKPWTTVREIGSKTWWKYAENLSGLDVYKEKKQEAEFYRLNSFKQELLAKCQKYSKIVIFGFTKIGQDVFSWLKESGIDSIQCFCDNSLNKQGQIFAGIKVEAAQRILELGESVLVIVVSQKFYAVIRQQLLDEGVQKKDIYRYTEKRDFAYYLSLDEQYYEESLTEILEEEKEKVKKLLEMDTSQMLAWLKEADDSDEEANYLINKYWMRRWILL